MDLLVLCRNGESASSHQHALDDHGIDGTVEEGRLSAGWRDQEMGLVVVHDFELAHRQPNRRKASTRVGGGSPLASLSDLRSGDYIVHLNHGIGRFRGMTTSNAGVLWKISSCSNLPRKAAPIYRYPPSISCRNISAGPGAIHHWIAWVGKPGPSARQKPKKPSPIYRRTHRKSGQTPSRKGYCPPCG